MVFFIRGVRNRITPLQISPVHQTNKTPHTHTCPLRKLSDCRLCLAPGLHGMFWNPSSCDSPRECPFLVLLPHGHAGQSPSLMKEFPRQVGSSAVRCYLALIPAGKGNQG